MKIRSNINDFFTIDLAHSNNKKMIAIYSRLDTLSDYAPLCPLFLKNLLFKRKKYLMINRGQGISEIRKAKQMKEKLNLPQ